MTTSHFLRCVTWTIDLVKSYIATPHLYVKYLGRKYFNEKIMCSIYKYGDLELSFVLFFIQWLKF
jgi:hypothetical protein